MKISASILDCKDKINSLLELNRTNINYIHIDVMDGKFVPNTSFEDMGVIREINMVTKYKMDVHLMVDNPLEYINNLNNMNIEYITIHLEIDKNIKYLISKIKELGYKVGLSIKPNTSVIDLKPYLNDIDMVLLMSVEPGMGGQSFIENTTTKIKELKELIKETNKDIIIEVDGGINNETISKIKDIDIAVVGSYITKSNNYYKQVEELLKAKENNKNTLEDNINNNVEKFLIQDKIEENKNQGTDLKLNDEENAKKIKVYNILFIIGSIIAFWPFIIILLIALLVIIANLFISPLTIPLILGMAIWTCGYALLGLLKNNPIYFLIGIPIMIFSKIKIKKLSK